MPCVYLRTTKLLLFTKGRHQTPVSPSLGTQDTSLRTQLQGSLPPGGLQTPVSLVRGGCCTVWGWVQSPILPLDFLESDNSSSLWHSPRVSCVHASDTYCKEERGERLPWGSLSRGHGPAGTAVASRRGLPGLPMSCTKVGLWHRKRSPPPTGA